ncbi:hypothetical protein GOODEAATRI_004228 [Goodea atripinnis]|uniref:Uncharacterized protein n=1 Tax=Goodea atripinnis TaxID=208336 RepID=A0ABV0PBG4_9TELE
MLCLRTVSVSPCRCTLIPPAARYRGAEGAGPLRAHDCAALRQKESERLAVYFGPAVRQRCHLGQMAVFDILLCLCSVFPVTRIKPRPRHLTALRITVRFIDAYSMCRSTMMRAGHTASFQRSNSHDKVRKIVAEEGRAARNLIAWSVPLENKEEEGG